MFIAFESCTYLRKLLKECRFVLVVLLQGMEGASGACVVLYGAFLYILYILHSFAVLLLYEVLKFRKTKNFSVLGVAISFILW